MSTDDKTKKQETLILSGDAAKDFESFFKSKEKPFDFGLNLILKYADNRILYNFLLKNKEEKFAKKQLIDNLKIIQRKWLKK